MNDWPGQGEYSSDEKKPIVGAESDDIGSATKRRRIDGKEVRRLSVIERLPHEILAMIFGHFDSVKLASFHIVCKRFHDVLSSDPTLWRDAMFLEGSKGNAFLVPAWQRVQELLKRSGGKIDRLGLVFDVYHLPEAHADFAKIVKALPKMDVREAYVCFRHTDVRRVMQRDHPFPYFPVGQYDSFRRHLRNALSKCVALESLWLQCESYVNVNTLYPRKQGHWPKLRHLELTRYNSWTMLMSAQVSLTFDHLHSLYVKLEHSVVVQELHALLRGCRRTLCDLFVFMVHEWGRIPPTSSVDITLPNVQRITWQVKKVGVKLHTPRLRHLTVYAQCLRDGSVTLPIAIETLAVHYSSNGGPRATHDEEEDLQGLHDFESLHSLYIGSIDDSRPSPGSKAVSQIALYTLASLRQVEVSEVETDIEAFVGLVKAMRQQMLIDTAYKIPLRLRIKTDRLKQKQARESINWLADNVTFLDIRVADDKEAWLITRLETFHPAGFDGALEERDRTRFW